MKNEKDIHLAKVSHILEILNNKFKLTSVQKFSRTEVYNVLAVPIFYMEA
jgi:predicted nucleic-acid-binding Zn-ribbon protein